MIKSGKNKNPIVAGHITKFIVMYGGLLEIGNNVGDTNSTIYCTNKIKIGSNVLIGGNCKIWDTDFHSLNPDIRVYGDDNQIKSGPIIIGDNVFIGGETIILKNVVLGDNSVIGAGSIVTKNIPANEIWAGNPAKFIKKI